MIDHIDKKKDTSKSKMNGIHKYLSSKGLHEVKHTRCVNRYIEESGAIDVDTFRRKCKYIQQDFGKFVQWYSQLIRLHKHLDF